MFQASLERGGSNDDDHDDDHRHSRRDDRDDRRVRYHDRQHDLGLASLLAKPDVLAAVNLIGQLGSLGGGFGGDLGGFGQVCVLHFEIISQLLNLGLVSLTLQCKMKTMNFLIASK